jgi:hypothetical protein
VTQYLLYCVAALAFVVWATRRLFLAWTQDYVKEVDDPAFGVATEHIFRTVRPRKFWFSVGMTSLLLLAALVFLYLIGVELVSGAHVQ